MNALPYYKRFPRDFLDGTIGLSLEEKGAYAIVLDLIYMRAGNLPDDARYIAGQLGCSVRKWTAIREKLIELGKLQAENGIISNFRANYLLEETRKFQDKQAENGAKSSKNNVVAKPAQKPKANQSDTDTEREETPSNEGVAREKNAKAAKRCPEGWTIPPDVTVTLVAEGYQSGQIERELAKFRDHEFKTARKDWPATFRNWVRNSPPEKARPHDPPGPQTFRERDFALRQENLERSFAASQRVADDRERRRREGRDFDDAFALG